MERARMHHVNGKQLKTISYIVCFITSTYLTITQLIYRETLMLIHKPMTREHTVYLYKYISILCFTFKSNS